MKVNVDLLSNSQLGDRRFNQACRRDDAIDRLQRVAVDSQHAPPSGKAAVTKRLQLLQFFGVFAVEIENQLIELKEPVHVGYQVQRWPESQRNLRPFAGLSAHCDALN